MWLDAVDCVFLRLGKLVSQKQGVKTDLMGYDLFVGSTSPKQPGMEQPSNQIETGLREVNMFETYAPLSR